MEELEKKYNDLLEQNKKLQSENTVIQKNLDELQSENTVIQKNLDELHNIIKNKSVDDKEKTLLETIKELMG